MAIWNSINGWCGYLLTVGLCFTSVLGQEPNLSCESIFTPPDPDQGYTTVYWPMPRATDVDGDPAAVTCDTPRGTRFDGISVVKCTATDTSAPDRTATCDIGVFVTPNFKTGCPADIAQESPTVTFQTPIGDKSFGNADPARVTCSHQSGDVFDAGLTLVTCTATDATIEDLVAVCSFKVTIGTLPAFEDLGSCNGTAIVNTAPDEGSNTARNITGRWVRPTQEGGEEAACDPDPDTHTFPAGVTTVTCTIADPDLPTLIDTCSFDVRVFPTFPNGCPDTIVTEDGSAVDFSPPDATDSAGTTVSGTCDRASNETYPDGETIVQCSATDSVETTQTVTCSFVVAVGTEPDFDSLGSCSSGFVLVPPDAGKMTATGLTGQWTRPTRVGGGAEAACDPDPDTATFQGDRTRVVCTIQNADAPSITRSCSFEVEVYPTFETDSLLGDPFRSPDPGSNYATYAYLDPLARNNIGGDLTVVCDPPSGSRFDGGSHDIQCIATDPTAGDKSTYTFTLNVAPTFKTMCPDDIIQASNPVNFTPPIGNNDSEGEPSPVSCTKNDGDNFEPGDTNVTCTVTDPVTTLVATCAFTVTMVVAPTFDASPPCDEDFDVEPEPDENDAIAVFWPERTATQTDGRPANVTCVPDYGSDFDAGDTNVTCTAADTRLPAGVTATAECTFRVRVYPTFVGECPDDIYLVPDPSGSTTIVTYETPEGAVDSGGELAANVTCDPASGSAFPNNNETVVTCTAFDSVTFGEATCTFTVGFSQAPTFAQGCPEDIVVAPDQSGVAIVTWDDITGNEDSTGQPAVVECDYESGATFNQTETLVSCTATDAGTKLTANCNFTVILDSEPPNLECPVILNVTADPGTNTANVTWDDPAVTDRYTPPPDILVVCIPGSGAIFPFGTTPVVCSAADSVDNIGMCAFEVQVTGATCPDPCPDNSVCTLQEDGESTCVCDRGYAGAQCTNENECESNPSPCHSDAICTDLGPPDFFTCQCKEGYFGDGIYSCELYFPAEYPDIPPSDGTYDLQKLFFVVLAVADASSSGCDPDLDKTSFECSILVQTFKDLVLPLYKNVSEVGFLDAMVNQTDIRKGSVVIPHTVSYNYSDPAIRPIRPEVFYQRSVEPDVQAGRLGNLLLEKNCQECTTPRDITDICSVVEPDTLTCPDKSVLAEVRGDNTGMCVYECVSVCQANSNYCNGGTCSQMQNEDAVCSECPEGMTGPRCMENVLEPPYEPDIPLIVGLTVGLGAPLLLIVTLNLLYCAFRGRCTKKDLEDEEDNGSGEHFKSISMEMR